MTNFERFEGCIIGGAIGDAWGSGFENQIEEEDTIHKLSVSEEYDWIRKTIDRYTKRRNNK